MPSSLCVWPLRPPVAVAVAVKRGLMLSIALPFDRILGWRYYAAMRYLEDFSPGQKYGTATVRVEADSIKAFARQFDPQPFHLDEVAAGRSLFKGLAASGWHTAAMTMRLLVEGEMKPAGGILGA